MKKRIVAMGELVVFTALILFGMLFMIADKKVVNEGKINVQAMVKPINMVKR